MRPARQTLIVAVLCVLAVVFQGLIAHRIAIRSAQPDFPLIVLACGAALIGGMYATGLGVLTGYLTAILTPTIDFGSCLASRTVAGAMAGALTTSVIRDSVWTPPIVAILSTIVSLSVFSLMAPGVWLHNVRHYLVACGGEVAYNAVLSYPIYFFMRRIGVGFRPEDPYAPMR